MKRDSTWKILSTVSGTRETRGRCYNHRKETATHLESNVWVPVLVLTLNHYMTMATGLSSLGNGASQVVLVVKRLPANAGDGRDAASIPGSGRSPGGGHGNPLQCPCLENPLDRGVHVVQQSQTWLKHLSTCDSHGNLYGTFIKSRAPLWVLCLYLYRLSHTPQVVDSCMTPYFKWGTETKKGIVIGPKPYLVSSRIWTLNYYT